jgi:hypothetical protein
MRAWQQELEHESDDNVTQRTTLCERRTAAKREREREKETNLVLDEAVAQVVFGDFISLDIDIDKLAVLGEGVSELFLTKTIERVRIHAKPGDKTEGGNG